MKRQFAIAAALISLLALLGNVSAQTYPAKPVRLVVPFGAGGITDIVARITAEGLSQQLGQAVVVENRPGAGGNIAAETVAKAPADGYTLLMTTAALLSVNPHIYARVPFDPVKDFAYVSLVASTPHVIVANPGVKAANLEELVTAAKARPESLSFGTAGNGSSPHQALALMQSLTGARFLHVPFKSGAESVNNVLAGNVSLTFEAVPVVISHVRAAKLKALALASNRRSDAMPDLPTAAEAGVPGLETGSTSGVIAPAATPGEVIATLNRAIRAALQTSQLRARLFVQGSDPLGSTPDEFRSYIAREYDRWGKLMKAVGVTAQ